MRRFAKFKTLLLIRHNNRVSYNRLIRIFFSYQIILDNGGFQPVLDCDKLTLCADYRLPASLRALGILEYSFELGNAIDQEKLIPAGSPLQIELRMTTVFCWLAIKRKPECEISNPRKTINSSFCKTQILAFGLIK